MTNAIITGASKGIGKAISLHLAEKGYNLLLLARNEKSLTILGDDLRAKYPNASLTIASVDVTNHHAVNEVISKFGNDNNGIHILINCAGYVKRGTSDIPLDELNKMLITNIQGSIIPIEAASKFMKKQKNGRIINLSSRNAKIPRSFLGGYAASKAAISAYSESLYKELASDNIKVTTLVPGFVNTQMTSDVQLNKEDLIQPEDINYFIDLILSLPERVALKEVCFEASPQIGAFP